MFKRKAAALDPNTTDTLIGEGSIFEGSIKSAAGIRIEGQVIGNIESEGDVTIGEKGTARSNIVARNIIIAGEVNGDVHAKSKLSITSKGKLYGNLTATSLLVEEGSIFEGTSRMVSVADTSSSQSPKKEKAAAGA
ncbi:Polymer-forming cytoskeletal [compost metagenome]